MPKHFLGSTNYHQLNKSRHQQFSQTLNSPHNNEVDRYFDSIGQKDKQEANNWISAQSHRKQLRAKTKAKRHTKRLVHIDASKR